MTTPPNKPGPLDKTIPQIKEILAQRVLDKLMADEDGLAFQDKEFLAVVKELLKLSPGTNGPKQRTMYDDEMPF